MVRFGKGLPANGPKYKQVLERLSEEILSGKYQAGEKFPSEAALVRQFGTSRITIGRAVRELKDRRLVERIPGSGTYVRKPPVGEAGGALFGLLIPNLGDMEIFEPICQGIAGAFGENKYALLWGRTESARANREEQALNLCRQFVERKVTGIFFAPLELTPAKDQVNRQIVRELEKARIPVVLLDRCFLPFPQRSRQDLVTIDHRRAGYIITEHLLKLGCRRIVFVAYPKGAPTVNARIAGFREALSAYEVAWNADFLEMLPAITEAEVKRMLDRIHPEAFVCVNDRTAGPLMHAVLKLGYNVPKDVRIVGIDDVEYARLLPVPLTTIHQPCREIGQAALAGMFDRIEHPTMLVRDIVLDCKIVVRDSCGARQSTS
jgi:DNA-binding LacI/PurR family transcriptional regulator